MLVKKVRKVIERLQKLEGYDEYNQDFCFYELTELLGKNENETIECLMKLTQEEIYWISGYFEDVSERLQSMIFIECLHKVQQKFPTLDLKHDIKCAESFLYRSWCQESENWKVRLLADRIDRFLNGHGDFYYVQSNEIIRHVKIKELLAHDKSVSDEYLKGCSKEVREKLELIMNE